MIHCSCEVTGDDAWEQVDNYGGAATTEILLILRLA